MTVNTTWTDPIGATLDKTDGDIITETNWDALVSNTNRLGGADGDTKTGVWELPDGSNSAPAYSFASDPDTGVYRSADNTIGFTTGGTKRASITGATVDGALAPRVIIPASAFYVAGTAGWAESATGAHQTTSYELKFDAATQESAEVRLQAPRNYAGGNITVRIQWHANATTGAAVWNWVTYNTAPGAVFDSSAATFSVTTTTDATANDLNESAITWTSSLPAAGDHLELRFTRAATDGADTLAVDAEVHQVIVEFGS